MKSSLSKDNSDDTLELVVRSSQLLLKLEAASERERIRQGKAIVIVS